MMRKLYTFTLFIFSLALYSQQGDFLLTDHFPRHSNLDNSNFEITNDNKGRICVANRSGVLKYDGDVWDFYQTPSAALSLAVDSTDIVYVGCINSVGFINYSERKMQYQSLIKGDTINDLFLETYFVKNKVYYIGNKNLIVYHIQTKEINHFKGDFINIYVLDDEVFVNSDDDETFLVLDSLQRINPKKKIAYANKRSGKPDLVIDFKGELFTYAKKEFQKLPQNKLISERGYEVQEIQWINDSLFVCSTFESGLLFFNINKPAYINITDYYSGLPDNEIYALHTDNANGVWAAHEFGITQISPLFPAQSYSHFPGLNGNLTSTSFYKNTLWVTTSLGLYYFDQDTIYENKVYYEVVSSSRKASKKPSVAATKEQEQEKNNPLRRLFGKGNRATANEEDDKKSKGLFKSIGAVFSKIDDGIDHVKGKLEKNARYTRKTKKIPVDIKYSFRKVAGANGKFTSIFPYKDRLLAVSNNGVYEIKKKEAEAIIKENIQTFTLNSQDQLILSTSDLSVKFYKLIKNVWVEQFSGDTEDIIVQLREDSKKNLWLAGSGQLYKALSTDSTFSIVDSYPLNNAFLDNVNLLEINNVPYFINSQGYFYYSEQDNKVKEDTQLKDSLGVPLHHLYDNFNQSVWVFTGKKWAEISSTGKVGSYEYLALFPDLRAINSSSNSSHLWLVTEENDLLKYDPNQKHEIGSFDFFLRKVSIEKGEIDLSKKFKLSYDENYFSVHLSKPDFLGLLNPEFQYRLAGLNTEWSDWTSSKTIDFSFLPTGNYELLVRSRDAFGRMEEGTVLSFSVTPPYWQTLWFYAIQIAFFGGLVLLSTRLNQNNSKNRLLSGALTLLTLVLIIEFLQSAISSYLTFESTPVIDLLLDAMVAFMIFPLERLLRELMTQGKVDVQGKIKKAKRSLVQSDAATK